MKGNLKAHLLVFASLPSTQTSQAFAQERAVGAAIGGWRVVGYTDPMTDEKSCTAYFGAGSSVQLTTKSFAISYRSRGMLRGYTIRFDDDPAQPTALPNRTEETLGALFIDAEEPRWERLMSAKRIRVQTLTLRNTIVDDDIDLSRLPAVMDRLNGPTCR